MDIVRNTVSGIMALLMMGGMAEAAQSADVAAETAAAERVGQCAGVHGAGAGSRFEADGEPRADNPRIKFYKLRSGRLPADIDIIAIIAPSPRDSAVEVPAVTKVCQGNKPITVVGKPGQIEFNSMPGKTITIRFHIEGLKHTAWKAAGPNESVWMADSKGEYHWPTHDSWPECLGPTKNATYDPMNGDLVFNMCSNVSADSIYTYVLHLDQTGQDAKVDVGIDPQIINHPTRVKPTP